MSLWINFEFGNKVEVKRNFKSQDDTNHRLRSNWTG